MKSKRRSLLVALMLGISAGSLIPNSGVQALTNRPASQRPRPAANATAKSPIHRTAMHRALARRTEGQKAARSALPSNPATPATGDHGHATPPKVIDIPSDQLLPEPSTIPTNLSTFSEIGSGTAIIFTPDLAGGANRQFYEALGFLYLEDTSWPAVLDRVISYNAAHKERPIVRLLLETHGNWGNGLKLQDGKQDNANRSYISLGALQERLEGSGVKECIISACNSGRLYRPEIYRRLNPADLLPANRGVINASPKYRPSPKAVKIMRRRESRFEALTPLFVSEMPKLLRTVMGITDGKAQIVVSDLFLEYVLKDPNLNLIEQGFARQISIRDYAVDHSEALIHRFLQMLEQIATTEGHSKQQVATGG